ncbi:ABC transporter ATP-binding protein [Lacticaseibacillus pantheris]
MSAIIQLDEVAYQPAATPILAHVNLTVQPADWLTIVGPSGSGKSTLLRLIATLISPTSGTILFQDRNQLDYDPVEYRRQVSYCFQQAQLFGDTVRDNISFPFTIRRQDFDEQLANHWLERFQLPTSMMDKPISELSGGEKQRVGLIRNVLFTPAIMLLDEVTTGLDTETKDIVHHELLRLNHDDGVTMIAVTHDETEIAAADHVLTVDHHTLEVKPS